MKNCSPRLALTLPLLALLAGCNAGNPNPPVFNAALSTPNLEFTLDAGNTASGYVFYNDANGESIAGNTDQLTGLSMDSTGKTGLLTLAPPANQMPGIYYLTIHAVNTNGTVSNIALVKVLPKDDAGTGASTITVVNFPMNGYRTQRAVVTLAAARNEISDALGLQLLTPALASPSPLGVNVNNMYATLNSGTNGYAISADLTVTLDTLQTESATIEGTTYTGGIKLVFRATPPSINGYVYAPYSETIYLNPVGGGAAPST